VTSYLHFQGNRNIHPNLRIDVGLIDMSEFIPSTIKVKVKEWRLGRYQCEYSAISEILEYACQEDDSGFKTLKFLRRAQFEALETYWYLRLVEKTPKIIDFLKATCSKPTDLLKSLGISIDDDIINILSTEGLDAVLRRIVEDDEFVRLHKLENAKETLALHYPSYIFALAMGAGKTYLIGAIIATEFAMALEYPGKGFVKNALVFAPGKTILGALKDISNISFEQILPERLYRPFTNSVKITYTQDGIKDIPVIQGSSYNLIVTNSEKIRIQKPTGSRRVTLLNFRQKEMMEEESEVANLRLLKIASLPNLAIFSDEAHHTYGRALDRELKKIRKTVDYLAENTNVIVVVNTTGTPYYERKMLKDVVCWYSLSEGIKDGILKEVKDNIISFEDIKSEDFVRFVIRDFYKEYKDVSIYDGSKAKLALYFPQTSDLMLMKPIVEKALLETGEDPNVALEVHNKSRNEIKDLFNNRVNEPSNPYRVFLLVNMGTEGWNCPSLFATALARKLKGSNNFVLQAASRCLRQTIGNKTRAKIYLSKENVNVLDRQLQETYGETLTVLNKTPRDIIRQRVVLRKIELPKISIKKRITRVVSSSGDTVMLDLKIPDIEPAAPVAVRLRIKQGEKRMLNAIEKTEVETGEEVEDLYQVAVELCSTYRVGLAEITSNLRLLYTNGDVPAAHIHGLRQQIEEQWKKYEKREEEIELALALVKTEGFRRELIGDTVCYTAEIMYHKSKEHLLVSVEDVASRGFGFHYDPYKFDSNPEKDYYVKILDALGEDPDDIEDIYFVGSFTDPKKTEFLFEYLDKNGKWRNYAPDFLIRKKNGKILIVEVKAERFRDERKEMALREIETLNPAQIKYEIVETDTDEIGFSDIVKTKEWIHNE
jgi:type III restriction enzyme